MEGLSAPLVRLVLMNRAFLLSIGKAMKSIDQFLVFIGRAERAKSPKMRAHWMKKAREEKAGIYPPLHCI